jgi:hypothetical protein
MSEGAGEIEITEGGALAKVNRAEWVAVAALSISILGGAFNLGIVYSDLQDAKRRVSALENASGELVRKVERIDANVEFLAELAREERGRR